MRRSPGRLSSSLYGSLKSPWPYEYVTLDWMTWVGDSACVIPKRYSSVLRGAGGISWCDGRIQSFAPAIDTAYVRLRSAEKYRKSTAPPRER